MISNYLKVILRGFLRQKFYSIINIFGLALGLAACLLILLFVQDELSYDKQFENHESIYRLIQHFPMGNHVSKSATVPFPTKNALLTDFPEIKKATIIYRPSSWGNSTLMKYDEDEYYEDDFVFAEPELLDIYKLEFIKGNSENALKGTNKLILTESTAKKYFGSEDPIGKRINLNNFRDLEVTAVIEDIPDNTHLKFSMIGSFETFKSFFNNPSFFETQWVWVAAWMYFTVDDKNTLERIRAGLPDFVQRHYPAVLADEGVELRIQKADDIHLNSSLELEFKPNGNIQNVYLFSAIAVLILFIAVINFMNLSTSRSSRRSREVGLRKVMGAYKRMLIFQFIGEALLTTFFALLTALVLIYLALPWFNNLTGKNISFQIFQNLPFLAGMILLAVLVGFLSGIYPAFVLSSFKPTEVLKGKTGKNSTEQLLRKILVVSQFVVSISLIICIGIVYKQLKYIQKKDLGFNTDQIMMADLNFNFFNRYESFKSELIEHPEIKTVTLLGGSIPGEAEIIENAFVPTGKPNDEQQWFSVTFAGHDFERVLGVTFIEGHSFRVGSSVDSTGFIINESAARALGWEKDVAGRSLDRIVGTGGNNIQSGTVIGLVEDFHYRPLYDPIKPLVIAMGGGQLSIKISSSELNSTILFVEEIWKKHFDSTPFRYSFMDQNYQVLYDKENKFSQTVQGFSILAIFIACLGLLGLSSFSTEARKKEIGIRKVNGASVFQLIRLLSWDFSKLIVIAFVISVPLALFFGNLWLDNFAYKTSIDIFIFIVSGITALMVAFLTVGYHTIKAALGNPVETLRYE